MPSYVDWDIGQNATRGKIFPPVLLFSEWKFQPVDVLFDDSSEMTFCGRQIIPIRKNIPVIKSSL